MKPTVDPVQYDKSAVPLLPSNPSAADYFHTTKHSVAVVLEGEHGSLLHHKIK